MWVLIQFEPSQHLPSWMDEIQDVIISYNGSARAARAYSPQESLP